MLVSRGHHEHASVEGGSNGLSIGQPFTSTTMTQCGDPPCSSPTHMDQDTVGEFARISDQPFISNDLRVSNAGEVHFLVGWFWVLVYLHLGLMNGPQVLPLH